MRTRPTLLLALLLCCTTHAHAQQTAATSGGDATGTGGMVSWTLGQSAYEPTTGSGGSVYRGVQQPYEWLITATPGHTAPTVALWPNPTADGITLQWSDNAQGPARYTVQSADGALVGEGRFDGSTAYLALGHLSAGTYSVQVYQAEQRTTTLTVIKQ
jgi:hypothetical protein